MSERFWTRHSNLYEALAVVMFYAAVLAWAAAR